MKANHIRDLVALHCVAMSITKTTAVADLKMILQLYLAPLVQRALKYHCTDKGLPESLNKDGGLHIQLRVAGDGASKGKRKFTSFIANPVHPDIAPVSTLYQPHQHHSRFPWPQCQH